MTKVDLLDLASRIYENWKLHVIAIILILFALDVFVSSHLVGKKRNDRAEESYPNFPKALKNYFESKKQFKYLHFTPPSQIGNIRDLVFKVTPDLGIDKMNTYLKSYFLPKGWLLEQSGSSLLVKTYTHKVLCKVSVEQIGGSGVYRIRLEL